MNRMQWEVVMKDVRVVFSNPMILAPILIVPLMFVVILPIIIVIGAHYGTTVGIQGMDVMVKNFPMALEGFTDAQKIIYIGANFMFPGFFLLIPIMASSMIAASAFVGEKELKTLENLFYTPISIRELFTAKVIGSFIPAYAVTLLAFIIFGIVINIGGYPFFNKLIFPDVKWLTLIFWLCPSIALLGIELMVWMSAKVHTFQESQQMVGLIIVPWLFLFIGQISGLFLLDTLLIIIIGAVIFAFDVFLGWMLTKKFSVEKLLS